MQWQVLPEAAVGSPLDLESPTAAQGFKDLTSDTVLPTALGQTVWLRFALPTTAMAQTWYLRIPRLRLDQATLYFMDDKNRWSAQTAGMNVPVVQWPVPTRLPSFQLSTRADHIQTYYLKLQNFTPFAEHPEFISPVEYIVSASLTGGLVGLMLGLFGLLTVLSLMTALLYRNSHFAWFALFVVSLLATQLILIGFAGQRIWPRSMYLNQIMHWVSALWALAACLWFILQISYAKQAFVYIYRISLGVIALLLLCSAVYAALNLDVLRDSLSAIAALTIAWSLGCLVWMAWRAQPWLWVVVAGFSPLAAAMTTRLAYAFGWVARIEATQLWGIIVSIIGMMVIYAGLIMRNRDTFAALQRESALSHTDLATGLTAAHMALARLPRVMARSARAGEACGVVMLHWTEFKKQLDPLSTVHRDVVLTQLGTRLRKLSRYIDTVARLDDDHFLLILESPVTRDFLTALGTKILTACMRPVDQFSNGAAFNVHLAMWINTDKPLTAQALIEALRTRLNQMGHGTQRKIQFVDSPTSSRMDEGVAADSTQATDRSSMLEKINALEIDTLSGLKRKASIEARE